jgi:hypothetical protein
MNSRISHGTPSTGAARPARVGQRSGRNRAGHCRTGGAHRHAGAGVAPSVSPPGPGRAGRCPPSGRPRRHDEAARGCVIALARTKPLSLGYPCALWPLARLPQALRERHEVGVTPATIRTWLQAEGLVWTRQQRGCQVQVFAAFVANRGPSSRPPRGRTRSGASSVSTTSDP